jgi:pSer/pThr/pTyr-binding forkhead associated (FHA) protein
VVDGFGVDSRGATPIPFEKRKQGRPHMTQTTSSPPVAVLELPPSAPRVRITAGIGSATQKTWNLRRPVTVIGSRRPAHIVLHDHDVSHAHCVIVNTGETVLVKDLHTKSGTLCNTSRIELTELKDGDVLTVGSTKIQVAVQLPEAGDERREDEPSADDPTLMPCPFAIGVLHTDQRWNLREAVALVGRLPAATVRLEHQDVSQRHAVLFRFGRGVGVFDLNGGRGLAVNGRLCPGAALYDGDRVTVGPFALQVTQPRGTAPFAPGFQSPAPTPVVPTAPVASVGPTETRVVRTPPTEAVDLIDARDSVAEITSLSSKLDALRSQISDSWGRLNAWPTEAGRAAPPDESGPRGKASLDAASREAELEHRDAMLRGQLHDVQQYHEQLAEREREVQAQIARLQTQQKALLEAETVCAKCETELERRAEDLARREHVVAQRWTRLMTSKCPHCGERLAVPEDPD